MNPLVSTNPSRGYETVGELASSTPEQVRTAIEKARSALPTWASKSVAERLAYMEKLSDVVGDFEERLIQCVTDETGKRISESRSEFRGFRETIQWLIDNAATHLSPQVMDSDSARTTAVVREPFGVVATISPWNFPISLFEPVLNQLVAGNTVVFKHSEECVLTGKLLEEAMAAAGFDEGVVNFVHGEGSVGEELVRGDVDKIFFTGSSKVGKQLYKIAAEKFLPITLELGGSSPGIIAADADLEATVDSVISERFSCCGQVCCALKRLIVDESILDEVVSGLVSRLAAWTVGDAGDESCNIGPLVAERQQKLISEQVASSVAQGAVVEIGGKVPEGLDGAYFEPTILTNVSTDMRVWAEEVFGPALPVAAYSSEAEAIGLANDTPYGLSAFVYTTNPETAKRLVSQLKAGQVSINGADYFGKNTPFGGYKQSGIGRTHGIAGLLECTQMKVVAEPAT